MHRERLGVAVAALSDGTVELMQLDGGRADAASFLLELLAFCVARFLYSTGFLLELPALADAIAEGF